MHRILVIIKLAYNIIIKYLYLCVFIILARAVASEKVNILKVIETAFEEKPFIRGSRKIDNAFAANSIKTESKLTLGSRFGIVLRGIHIESLLHFAVKSCYM